MIKFMVDSASDLINQSDLYDYFIPISVNIDGKEYSDGIDLNAEDFYKLLSESNEFPKTSQPSPQMFLQYFEEVKEMKDKLIYFALSSGLSGTYQSAMLANFPIYLLYSSGEENSEILKSKLVANGYSIKEKYQIGSSIGAHTGPGVYGFAFVEK